MTAAGPDAQRRLVVLASSSGTRRSLGPLPWAMLEALALRARLGVEGWVADASVRAIAAEVGVGKDAAAGALRRLVGAGLVSHASRRAGGSYADSVYVLNVGACQRAGLLLSTNASLEAPCPPAPCPDEPVAAQPDPASPDTVLAGMGEAASPNEPACRPAPISQATLFALPDQPSSVPPSEPTTPNDPNSTPSNEPSYSKHHPLFPTNPSFPLPPTDQPDALAPGVRPGGVNVAGNEGRPASGLNGNLNGKGRPC